jgi:hypothetical protein
MCMVESIIQDSQGTWRHSILIVSGYRHSKRSIGADISIKYEVGVRTSLWTSAATSSELSSSATASQEARL